MENFQERGPVFKIAVFAALLTVIMLAGAFFVNSWGGNHSPEVTASPEPSVTPEPTEIPVTPYPDDVTPEPVDSQLYAGCEEVWNSLGRPITLEDEGYSNLRFDLDSDGVGCEDDPATEEDESSVDWKAIWDRTKGNAEDFAKEVTPKLKDFWSETLAPSLENAGETISELWNDPR